MKRSYFKELHLQPLKTPLVSSKDESMGSISIVVAFLLEVTQTSFESFSGVNHNDIVILERHLVYSLSEEKTAARFYIMKCTSEDKFSGEIPVEETLNW